MAKIEDIDNRIEILSDLLSDNLVNGADVLAGVASITRLALQIAADRRGVDLIHFQLDADYEFRQMGRDFETAIQTTRLIDDSSK